MRYVGLIIVYLGVLINTIILWKCYSKIDLKLRTNNTFHVPCSQCRTACSTACCQGLSPFRPDGH